MKFAGIIAEYDPFHNGHAWQLAQAKALGAQHVAVAMSCGLTQRGALPLLPEAVRVQAALQCGADLIFALPAPCACAQRLLPGRGCASLPPPGAMRWCSGQRRRTQPC
jgi:predicted nucleotidyltransferase